MQTRRQTLKQSAAVAALAAGSGLLPQSALAFNKAAFEVNGVNGALKALGVSGDPVASGDVTLTAPDIAENGAVVPFALSTKLPDVKQLVLLVEKNPFALAAVFDVTPEVEANFATRSKMGETSDVYAVAITKDNKAYFAKKEVKVTLGGCGG
ncbi:thiosulfate oxidation carrier protein SoxY [Comamonas sp. NLF-1-9]|uniref:thiosulfate oxidation carrier protein SoxY n=1 Tax=Comamonas sp. NLF-1-9 TaxID=2853163 RepID=UPI001C49202A|nr:thiosulfate oxidation carrier protein SoxY [Comamonas sp. NLF-1-9]QXL84833.1 thiosulfate oxidation carrier protein SoxY [Comamonas sp. NLF-1-9]